MFAVEPSHHSVTVTRIGYNSQDHLLIGYNSQDQCLIVSLVEFVRPRNGHRYGDRHYSSHDDGDCGCTIGAQLVGN
jgi:hypothetical protein